MSIPTDKEIKDEIKKLLEAKRAAVKDVLVKIEPQVKAIRKEHNDKIRWWKTLLKTKSTIKEKPNEKPTADTAPAGTGDTL